MSVSMEYVEMMEKDSRNWWAALSESRKIEVMGATSVAQAEKRFNLICPADRDSLSKGHVTASQFNWSE